MRIDLPSDVIERVQTHVSPGVGPGDVVRRALDAMERLDEDRRAIQEAVDSHNAGEGRDWDRFAAEFRAESRPS